MISLQWLHNGRDSVSNHQPHDCLLNRLFRRRSKKTSSSASLAFVRGIHRGPVNSPHKWPVTRKMFQLDDVIMLCCVYFMLFMSDNSLCSYCYMLSLFDVKQILSYLMLVLLLVIATCLRVIGEKRVRGTLIRVVLYKDYEYGYVRCKT